MKSIITKIRSEQPTSRSGIPGELNVHVHRASGGLVSALDHKVVLVLNQKEAVELGLRLIGSVSMGYFDTAEEHRKQLQSFAQAAEPRKEDK